jgi:hypothetical protein
MAIVTGIHERYHRHAFAVQDIQDATNRLILAHESPKEMETWINVLEQALSLNSPAEQMPEYEQEVHAKEAGMIPFPPLKEVVSEHAEHDIEELMREEEHLLGQLRTDNANVLPHNEIQGSNRGGGNGRAGSERLHRRAPSTNKSDLHVYTQPLHQRSTSADSIASADPRHSATFLSAHSPPHDTSRRPSFDAERRQFNTRKASLGYTSQIYAARYALLKSQQQADHPHNVPDGSPVAWKKSLEEVQFLCYFSYQLLY